MHLIFMQSLTLLALVCVAVVAFIAMLDANFKPGSDFGYNLGLIGSLMMLLLLLYPIRKHVKQMQGWGPLKYWLEIHMIIGVAGPLLVLVHTKFQLGSLNATLAFWSMLIVAISGIFGRFVYTHIHRGLHGIRVSLKDVSGEVEKLANPESDLKRLPQVAVDLISKFEKFCEPAHGGWLMAFWRFSVVVPYRNWTLKRIRSACDQDEGLSRKMPHGELERIEDAVDRYFHGLQQVAQFGTYERLFSLWHVAHVPFVVLLAVSAIYHVIAVHMY
jgi:hypothetical protein